MLAAPITPVDLAQVRGSAAWPLPAGASPRVGGNEGVGVVEAVGAGVALKKDDFVIASSGGVGTWATHVVSSADAWTALPAAARDATLETLAASIAPVVTAKGMLEGFVKLRKGARPFSAHGDPVLPSTRSPTPPPLTPPRAQETSLCRTTA